MKCKVLAAIDIGSNAIRLLINNVENSNGTEVFKKAAFLRVPIRLGEDTFTKGLIDEPKALLLNEAMSGFAHIMKAYQVSSYMACATSAMRDAANGNHIIKSIKEDSGLDIQIIDGKTEAEYIFEAGGLDAVMDKTQNYLYVDVGGGSTEVIVYSKQRKQESQSFQIGTVRMLEGVVSKEETDRFKKWLKEIYKKYTHLSVIASGGNINKIHKLLGKTSSQILSYTELKGLYDELKNMTYEQRMQNYKLNTYRADVIIPAMKIFITVGKNCAINDYHVPKVGLVDGLIHHLYHNPK